MLFLFSLALLGLTLQAGAQSFGNGSQDCSDPSQQDSPACTGMQQQSGTSSCSDPTSPLCSQSGSGSRSGSMGMQNGSQGQSSSLQQMSDQTYNDSNLATRQPRSTDTVMSVHLPADPLTEFQKFVASTTGQVLPVYGSSLFRDLPSTFAPLDQTPVPANYGIGPNDELRIRIWGHINLTADQKVDRSGNIYLPQVGTIHVGGLPYSELKKHISEAVGRIYRNFELTVEVGQIRAVQVYVTGQARRPGLYTVSSLSTLVNLLFTSGGPSPQGSMRHAELKRDGKTVVDFDLYDLLLRGDKDKDVPLLSGDILFIPAVGPKTAMTGSVVNPAIYELRQGESLGELLKNAGGYSESASVSRISIDRIEDHSHRMTMEIASDTISMAAPLNDGDIVRILPIVPGFEKTVTLRGNLGTPGRFAWHAGMRLSDLIPDRNALITRNYWWKRTQLGLPAPEFEPLDSFYNLRQPTTPLDVPLTSEQKQQFRKQHAPDAIGSLAMSGATSSTGLSANQGATGSQSASSSQSALLNPQNPLQPVTPTQCQDGSQVSDPARCPELSQTPKKPFVLLPKNDVQLDVAEINWDYAVIERTNPETLKTSLVPFDLGRLVQQHDPAQDLDLQPGDVVTIFSQADIHVPRAQQTKFVRIEGEVAHAGIYSVKPGETLRDLVREAGGLTPDAYLYGSVFTRLAAQLEQQKRIDDYIQSLEMQIQSVNTGVPVSGTAGASASSVQDLATAGIAQKMEMDIIAHLHQVRAIGRVVLAFKPDSSNLDSIPAISLENGDSFVVPSVPSSISVVGAVNSQNAFLYDRARRAGGYLRLAGGTNRTADAGRAFVIRADGSVVGHASAGGPWGGSLKDLAMNPGDTLVIPEKVFDPTHLRTITDMVGMLSQLAMGTAMISYYMK